MTRSLRQPVLLRHAVLLAPALLAAWSIPLHAQIPSRDSDLPIEITADSLEVLQNENIATFAGNVDAVQGDLVLSADTLRVYYRGDDDREEPPAPDESDIQRIEAIGNVFLTAPGETAQGQNGVYDVSAQTVTLEGAVVLTRERNVIRGDRLEMDLASGRSRVVAAAAGREGAQPGERVRAIFSPAEGGTARDAGEPEQRGEGRPRRESSALPAAPDGMNLAARRTEGEAAAAAPSSPRRPRLPAAKPAVAD